MRDKGKNVNNFPIVAICYDFDKTLSPRDMQNYSLLPKLNCEAADFWAESNKFAKDNFTDKILSYMKLILEKSSYSGIPLRKDDFRAMGKDIELFDGVDTWFKRINEYADTLGLKIEHYIISAGLKEIIEGTSIAHYFTHIYASSFVYGTYGEPKWPGQVVNYTTKTQYLFRISKDCLDLSDEDSINNYIPEKDRRIPFRNFIYIGDSETDIPAMKIIKNGGGTSIGVYDKANGNLDHVRSLLENERIDYFVPADYSNNSRMEVTVKAVLDKIKSNECLNALNKRQNKYIEELSNAEYFCEYTKELLDEIVDDEEFLKMVKKQTTSIFRKIKKNLSKYESIVPKETTEHFINNLHRQINELFSEKKQRIQLADAQATPNVPLLPIGDGETDEN
ncbi:MAG: haloacid dehalogenase-like hydrolase [Clostridiales bacterium]|nr:haloacid dehalogenase-like hydrolase [Clostridiales bacterium]